MYINDNKIRRNVSTQNIIAAELFLKWPFLYTKLLFYNYLYTIIVLINILISFYFYIFRLHFNFSLFY